MGKFRQFFGVFAAVATLGRGISSPRDNSGYSIIDDCHRSDAQMRDKRETVCSSLVQAPTPWCGDSYKNVTAKEDWPNQAVYMQNLLEGLLSPSTCLNTSYAEGTINWLNTSQVHSFRSSVAANNQFGAIFSIQAIANISGAWMWTYDTFQVQYYDMPRKPGERIESPATLGRKCWAFAYLAQVVFGISQTDWLF